MKLLIDLAFFLIIGFYTYRFIQLLLIMQQQKLLFPQTEEERAALRKQPEQILEQPTVSKQKFGIILSAIYFFFAYSLFTVGLFIDLDWMLYVLLLSPLTYAEGSLRMFALVDVGIIDGGRFVPWERMTTVTSVPIDMNHRFYGYERDVNNGYEVIVKVRRGRAIRCIVIAPEVVEQLGTILQAHGVTWQPAKSPE